MAQELLREFARVGSGAIAAPSANRFGHVSPTTAEHVREEFGAALFILDGGPCELGLESTIVDLSRGAPVLLRPGAVTREDIGRALGELPRDRDAGLRRAFGHARRALLSATALRDRRPWLASTRSWRAAPTSRCSRCARRRPRPNVTLWIAASGDPARYGTTSTRTCANRRERSQAHRRRAAADDSCMGSVNDRLRRAAAERESSGRNLKQKKRRRRIAPLPGCGR